MRTTARNFFSEKEKSEISSAVANAEMNTSGEIRVHIDLDCKGDIMDRAATVFAKLGMVKTRERNGVLFYLAIKPRRFAVLGDAGIDHKVPANFWENIKTNMQLHFKEGQFALGLTEAIAEAGHELKNHFPLQKDDKNELPNTISFEN